MYFAGTRSLAATATVSNVLDESGTTSGTLAGAGPFDLQSPGSFSGTVASGMQLVLSNNDVVVGSIVNHGTVTLNGHRMHVFDNSTISNDGLFDLSGGNSVVDDANNTGANNASFVNSSTGQLVAAAVSGDAFVGTASFNNQGTVSVTGTQELDIYSTVANISAGTLTGGSWNAAAGLLRVNGADLTTDAANVTLAGGAFDDTSSHPSLPTLTTVAPGGTLTLTSTANLTVSGPLTSAGTTTVNSGSTLAVTGQFDLTGGITTVAGGGTLQTNGSEALLSAGVLTGGGSVPEPMVNQGATVSPGQAILTMPSFQQGSGGTYQMTVGGTSPGSGYSQLAPSGNAVVGGTLVLNHTAGFSPANGQTYTIVLGAVRVGRFKTVTDNLGQPVTLTYTSTSVVVNVQ